MRTPPAARPSPPPGSMRRRTLRAPGFTLIEILVALAILVVALAAVMRSVAQSSEGATLLKQRTLALWVAQNRLAVAQLANQWPPLGVREGVEEQARAGFVWRETVGGTPNPGFRKIDIAVADATRPDYVLARLVGYLGAPPP